MALYIRVEEKWWIYHSVWMEDEWEKDENVGASIRGGFKLKILLKQVGKTFALFLSFFCYFID